MAHVPASLYTRNGTRAEHAHDALLAARGLQAAATAAAGVAAAVGGDRCRVLDAADLEAATGHGAERGLEARAGRLGGGAAGGAHLEVDGGECPAPSSARTRRRRPPSRRGAKPRRSPSSRCGLARAQGGGSARAGVGIARVQRAGARAGGRAVGAVAVRVVASQRRLVVSGAWGKEARED